MSISSSRDDLAVQSIELVNRERVKAGCPRLTADPVLNQVALAHSVDMARRGFYAHINRQSQGPSDRIAAAGYVALASAENIARGYTSSAAVVEGWMNSPGHRANILNCDFRTIGAGFFATPAQPDGNFWTHLFATPDPSLTRDRSQYPTELVGLINRWRTADHCPRLEIHPSLQRVAQTQTVKLAQQGPRAWQNQAQQSIDSLAQQARYAYRRIVAQITAGGNSATPEQALDELMKGGFRSQLFDCSYREIGVGYHFVRDDDHRHYWLLLLTMPAA